MDLKFTGKTTAKQTQKPTETQNPCLPMEKTNTMFVEMQ